MLQEENWDSVYNTNNIDEIFNNFQNTLITYLLTYLLTHLLHGAESFLSSWLACS